MKKFLLYLCLTFTGLTPLVSYGAVPEDFSRPSGAKSRKARADNSIEGIWRFRLGDYYFDDSSMGTLEYDLEASFYEDLLFFEEENDQILPMAARLDEATGELSFTAGNLGPFYDIGYLIQYPAFYNPTSGKFENGSVTATYDADAGTIEFPLNSAMQWWVFDEFMNPMFSIDAYTFEGATKISGKRGIDQIVINKGWGNSTTLNLTEFSRIDFKDGYIEFDTPDRFTLPLAELLTIHFEKSPVSSSVEVNLGSDVRLTYGNGWLALSGLPEGSRLDIFALNGTRVKSLKRYLGEPVDISSLDEGVYIVKSGKHSFKFVK